MCIKTFSKKGGGWGNKEGLRWKFCNHSMCIYIINTYLNVKIKQIYNKAYTLLFFSYVLFVLFRLIFLFFVNSKRGMCYNPLLWIRQLYNTDCRMLFRKEKQHLIKEWGLVRKTRVVRGFFFFCIYTLMIKWKARSGGNIQTQIIFFKNRKTWTELWQSWRPVNFPPRSKCFVTKVENTWRYAYWEWVLIFIACHSCCDVSSEGPLQCSRLLTTSKDVLKTQFKLVLQGIPENI